MHIPDGFLSLPILISTNGVSFFSLFYSTKKVSKNITLDRIPLMGVCAAFVFVVQLVVVPLPFGTSIHLIGSVLISILLGPNTGLLAITSALILQALLFQHGGILTLGANILNIGTIGCYLGYLCYKIFKKFEYIGVGISSFFVITIGAIFCVLELSLSGKIDFEKAIIFVGVGGMFLGIIEGVVTCLILSFIKKIRPDVLKLEKI